MAMPVGQVLQEAIVARALAPGAVKPGGNETCPMLRPTKLFIGGITRNTTTKQLRDHFTKYGRVLDCVAMRQGDGRPRGFGYVTLDSSAAADDAMAVAQVIDGRVVDMKRAVPEGSMSSSPQSRMHTPSQKGASGKMTPQGQQEFLFDYCSSPLAVGWPWNNPAVAAASAAAASLADMHKMQSYGLGMSPDCVELLSGTHAAPPGLHLGSDWDMPSTPTAWGANLSAEAPEFVPGSERPVLGEITNSNSLKVQKISPAEPGLVTRSAKAKSLEINTDDIENVDPETIEPAAEMSPMYASAPARVEEGDDDSTDEEETDDEFTFDTMVDGPPPSIGSVEHSTGNCKRCNFFPKGRCQNGAQCSFCHYPHEKRKPSRQEKRDRRAAWASSNEEAETLGSLALPRSLPSPLALTCEAFSELAMGLSSPAYSSYASTPAGFTMSWQPDEEVSPMCGQAQATLLATGPPLLSTVPVSPQAAQPLAKMVTMGTQTDNVDTEKIGEEETDATYTREELLRLRVETEKAQFGLKTLALSS